MSMFVSFNLVLLFNSQKCKIKDMITSSFTLDEIRSEHTPDMHHKTTHTTGRYLHTFSVCNKNLNAGMKVLQVVFHQVELFSFVFKPLTTIHTPDYPVPTQLPVTVCIQDASTKHPQFTSDIVKWRIQVVACTHHVHFTQLAGLKHSSSKREKFPDR